MNSLLPALCVVAALPLLAVQPARAQQTDEGAVLENQYVRYVIDGMGRSAHFVDKRDGTDYCPAASPQPFATLRKGGKTYLPSRCAYANGKLTLDFSPPGVTATFLVTPRRGYFVFALESLSDEQIDELTFGSLRLSLPRASAISGAVMNDKFAACLRVLDPGVGFRQEGGVGTALSAVCTPRLKLVGAKAALVGAPINRLRPILKAMMRREGQPWSPLGGPFALDAEENRGSYVFAFGLSEANVDDWIKLCKSAGIAEVHLIDTERTKGHYAPNETLFPGGVAGLTAVVRKIHAAGLRAGMHTLTGCISPDDAYITPVPDARLATDASFTLTAPMDANDTEITVAERPADLDVIWAYGGKGNVLRIGDELVQYSGYTSAAPYKFTGCRRGAFGTRPAAHPSGAPARHLYVRYGCFLPDPSSTLVDDIGSNIATTFNACGFDMIYMDGAEGTPGGEYGVARMREAIFRRLKGRVQVEASEWGYASWPFHSRIGAWDYPNWGLKPFLDIHARSNAEIRATSLLPAQLGWWAILGPSNDTYAELPDEVEYLCTRALAYDMPLSFQGLTPGKPANMRQDEYLDTIGRYEKLRLARYFPEAILAQLRAPGADFHLLGLPENRWQLVPTDYLKHRYTGADDGSGEWTVTNRFAAQPVRLRIRALHSAAPYDSPEGKTLTDFQAVKATTEASPGASCALTTSTEEVKAGGVSGVYTAHGEGKSAWTRAAVSFSPPLDLSRYGAFGVWVYGDGKQEVLNFQLTNPLQYWPTYDEHYVTVDFTGWRYFELHLRERDAERAGDYPWPYGGDAYAIYRNPLIRTAVSGLNVYCTRLPVTEARCYISPVRALPVSMVKLTNPSVEIGGKRVTFPVTLESGQYLEFDTPEDCRMYDDKGRMLGRVAPQGDALTAQPGDNAVRFAAEGQPGYRPRAEVTVILAGEPLTETK